MDYPTVAGTSIGQATWDSWRGTPELVAQIARASARAARQEGSPKPRCRLEVSVKGDLEEFDSPEAFQDRVTREALRDFDHLWISVGEPDDDLLIHVRLSRFRLVGAPDATHAETPDPSSEDPVVVAILEGDRASAWRCETYRLSARGTGGRVAAATSIVRAAIDRGRTRRGERVVLAIGTLLVVLATLASVSYLLLGQSGAIPRWVKELLGSALPLIGLAGVVLFAPAWALGELAPAARRSRGPSQDSTLERGQVCWDAAPRADRQRDREGNLGLSLVYARQSSFGPSR
jgi:hypothetical protein